MAVAGSATVSAKIQSLLQGQAEDRIVSTVDEILRELEQQCLAYRLSIPPRLMGVHPCNRDGYGISATGSARLGLGDRLGRMVMARVLACDVH